MDFKALISKYAKPFFFGALSGALLISWVGFNLVGWTTSSTAERAAKKKTEDAVAGALAKICVAQFNGAANLPERLTQLQKADRWSRGGVLAKEGYANMPGDKAQANGVADACANLLVPEKS